VQTKISFGEAFRYWLRLGFVSFGGPTGQIAIMNKDLVDKKKWIDEELPEGKGFDCYALAVAAAAFVGMIRFKWGMIPVIIGSALVGFIWKMFI
jgi:chromate transport protein ChrA